MNLNLDAEEASDVGVIVGITTPEFRDFLKSTFQALLNQLKRFF